MSKSDNLKSPFGNMIHIIPPSDGKALRKAFYNTIAIVFVAFVLSVGVAVFFILQAFLKPLIWATMVGTCLHPFKYTLTEYTRQWFISMDTSGQPLVVSALTLPIQLLNGFAEFTIQKIIKYSKLLLFICFGLPVTYIIYHYGPLSLIIHGITECLIFLSETIGIFSTYWVASIIIGYLCLVLFYWRPHTSYWLKHLSIPIWCIIIVYLAAMSGPFRVPLFLLFIFLMLTGAVTYAKDHNKEIFSWSHLGVIWEFITRPRGRSNSLANIASEEDSSELLDDGLQEDGDLDYEQENGEMEFKSKELVESGDTTSGTNLSDSPEITSQVNETPLRPDTLEMEQQSTEDTVDTQISTKSEQSQETSEIEKVIANNSDISTEDEPSSSSSWSAIINWCNNLFSRDTTDSVPVGSPLEDRPSLRRSRSHPSSSFYASQSSSSYSANYPGLHQPTSRKGTVKRAFIVLLWAHVLVYSWSHLWVLEIMPLLLMMVALKKMFNMVRNNLSVQWFFGSVFTNLETALGDRSDALAPIPVRGIFKLMLRGDKKIRHFVNVSLDSLVSISVILSVIIGTIFFTGFLAFQIHSESIHFVSMTSSVLNDTMHSELSNWLPEREYLKNLFDSMMDNAYVFGREWISKKIDQVLDTNPYNKARIEEQVLELWDKLYHRIISKNESFSNISDAMQSSTQQQSSLTRQMSLTSLPLTFNSLWQTLSSFDGLDLQQVITLVKENLGLLSTVLESIWLLLKSNLNLCLSLITAVFSMVFGGGTVVLNFLVSLLIFLSTLFYLLAFSGESYLPVQFITSLTPAVDNNPTIRRFYSAVEAAINGVFEATLKMAVFYGFYTVLTHTLFGVNLVVIPSVMAATFGAIPFLGTYWAALPAVMELLLVHNEVGLAITLFVLHLLPTYFLDTAIYSEIKGAGHPYMTGLAIAGGVYCLGLEGAIVGPILLCFLLVGVNFYSNMLAPGGSSGGSLSSRSTTPCKSDHTDVDGKSRRYGGGRKVQFNSMSRRLTIT